MSYDDERRRTWSAAEEKRKQQQRAPGDVWREQVTTTGGQLVETVKSIIREGNVTRIIIRQDGKVLLDIPIAIGAGAGILGVVALGTAAFPIAAVAAIAAVVTHCTVEIERIQR